MNYLSALNSLMSASSTDDLAGLVNSINEQLIANQGYDKTMEYRKFMLTNQAELNVVLRGLADYVARNSKPIKKLPNENGIIVGFRYVDTSTRVMDYLALAIAGDYAVYIISSIDKVQNIRQVRVAYGCVLSTQWLADNTTDSPQSLITRVSTLDSIKKLLKWLDMYGKYEKFDKTIPDKEVAKPFPFQSKSDKVEKDNKEIQRLNNRISGLLHEISGLVKVSSEQAKANRELMKINNQLVEANNKLTETVNALSEKTNQLIEQLQKPSSKEDDVAEIDGDTITHDPFQPPEGHEPIVLDG